MPDVPIVGDIWEAWHYFKWLKIEKKAFNNIDWKLAYKYSRSSIMSELAAHVDTAIHKRPDYLISGNVKVNNEWLTPGFHFFEDGTCSYLELPLDPNVSYKDHKSEAQAYVLGVNEAIDLASPYLPSFIEIYTTYIATGDLKLADEIYNYYTTSSNCEMEITVYQLLTVTEEHRGSYEIETEYLEFINGVQSPPLSKGEYETKVAQAKQQGGSWAWLGDLIDEFVGAVNALVDDATNAVKELLGFYYKVESDYVGAVTKGMAYDYTIEQEYAIKVEQGDTETAPESPNDYYVKSSDTISYTRTEEVIEEVQEEGPCSEMVYNGPDDWYYEDVPCPSTLQVVDTIYHTHVYQARTTAYYMRDITIWTDTLRYVSSSIEEYEEKTRYQWVFKQVVEENDLKYTEDDVAIAIDTINAFQSRVYGLDGGASARNFVLAGELNTSLVTFATQFEEKNLAYMLAVDDTGTFWTDEWCAMFVTYNMRKAGVPIAFSSCSSFRRYCLKYDVPGFYDIVDPKCYGVKSGNVTKQPEHMGSYNDIQVRRYITI